MAKKDRGRIKPGPVPKDNRQTQSKKDSRKAGRSGPKKNRK